jgi:hypothetical protein
MLSLLSPALPGIFTAINKYSHVINVITAIVITGIAITAHSQCYLPHTAITGTRHQHFTAVTLSPGRQTQYHGIIVIATAITGILTLLSRTSIAITRA